MADSLAWVDAHFGTLYHGRPQIIALRVYETQADFARFDPVIAQGRTSEEHGMSWLAVAERLQAMGHTPRLVVLRSRDYDAWREAQGNPPDEPRHRHTWMRHMEPDPVPVV